MMTRLFSVIFGLVIGFRACSFLVFFRPLVVFLVCQQLSKVEEPGLVLRFGEIYLDYKELTPRDFFLELFAGGRKL